MPKYNNKDEFMDPKTIDADLAIATAAEGNLYYVKISDHMYNVLQDLEPIMMNQMSDIFDLLNWVGHSHDHVWPQSMQ